MALQTESKAELKKHRGIPEALFLEDVDDFMKKNGSDTAESVLKDLDEQHQKYKFMELNLMSRKKRLQTQVPDLNSSLEMVTLLTSKRIVPSHFRADSCYLIRCIALQKYHQQKKSCCGLGPM
ncbi:Prefoldin subunit 3 [Desmophyllum pertusum]|uniref:Prefoldin subunit 3 n=1 Tax=Desmophyllum pertusum TaxID=174260 RepID=A0A9X0DC71_9CNID|nr:Prefoldin subunit 3 [Desmophyllum pertusum]